jgi:hypothetical protein
VKFAILASMNNGGRAAGIWRPLLFVWLVWTGPLLADDFQLRPDAPTMDRWVYPFGDFQGDRPVAPTFASFDSRFDTRDGQFLLGWDTGTLVATNAGPKNYLIRRARLTLTITADQAFVYDPTLDAFQTYATNQPGYVPDADPGRPVELYGAGFRNGFTAATFTETSFYGPINPITSTNISIGTRNAFAAMHGPDGTLIDVSNNVGQANAGWTNAPFEVRPWAIGQTADAAPGDLVPADAKFTFDVDLSDPLVVGYLQSALSDGRLRLFVSSLSPAEQITPGGTGGGGGGAYPQWATRENLLYDVPALELDGTLVSAADTDGDGLPDDWERFYFGDLSVTANGDPDGDGMTNAAELAAGTDPTNAASVFRILKTGFDADGNATLRFTVAPSRTYRVEFGVELGNWNPAHGTLTYPEPGVAEFREQKLNVPPGTPPQEFYRVIAE